MTALPENIRVFACVFIAALLGTIADSDVAHSQLILPAPETVEARDCAECPELVQLPSGLFISRAPITLEEFRVFAAETGYGRGGWGCNWDYAHIEQEPDHPAVCLTFEDASAYADWLAKKTGRAYRLPSLSEMRYAALANSPDSYWWGRSVGKNRANCVVCGSPYDGKGTSPVSTFPPNDFGLYDAVGNAWIWTGTCVAEDDCSEHFLVGGGWSSPPADLRVSKTISNTANVPYNNYGMRVVRPE
ncbi:formylglycine-generating enzyme family protein [Jiella marina]|uniref:formylglycine-generating enzyme family protein n=1 Tax=Jiella sp. LLJ827 TaxID=2917712 RepID=UPI002101CEA9|nr:SUMF1/EgtB/PvdO family nonheme iron enzyme [Jiella sp. LLJ827]MCQ0986589.1 formylglycine-generating enzyme family protein [Jiella sp. LLJ827]